ncbi:hypothetical protein ACFX13_018210 [Malus domestica]
MGPSPATSSTTRTPLTSASTFSSTFMLDTDEVFFIALARQRLVRPTNSIPGVPPYLHRYDLGNLSLGEVLEPG